MPPKKEETSHEQRKKALWYLIFIKEKHDSNIKAVGCANRRSQREFTTRSDKSSPTVSLVLMMMSCAIEVKDNRVTDIPGWFIHAAMEEEVNMQLAGTIAELIVKLNPNCTKNKYGEIKNNKPVLYVRHKKAIYDKLQVALLF